MKVIKKINNYLAFADESSQNKGRYRSVCMITMHESEYNLIDSKMKSILKKYNLKIKTFKWSKMNNSSKVSAIKEFLEFLFPLMLDGSVRINVLIWDILDKRHKILGRDDDKNLSLMYYRLIKYIATDILTEDEFLKIYPDRNSAMDWTLLEEILINDGVHLIRKYRSIQLLDKRVSIEESSTEDEYLIQIADIFAGLAKTSYVDYDDYELYNMNPKGQQTLVPLELNISNKQKCKFEIYKIIDDWAKKNKLGVSLKSNRGFRSYKRKDSLLNFWFYEPQHDDDNAPVKNKNK